MSEKFFCSTRVYRRGAAEDVRQMEAYLPRMWRESVLWADGTPIGEPTVTREIDQRHPHSRYITLLAVGDAERVPSPQ